MLYSYLLMQTVTTILVGLDLATRLCLRFNSARTMDALQIDTTCLLRVQKNLKSMLNKQESRVILRTTHRP